MEKKDEGLRSYSQVAIRCAKAAILLSSLSDCHTKPTINEEDEVRKLMQKEIEDLKAELVRERMKSKKIKLCGLLELVLQVMTVLFVFSFILMMAFKSN